MRIGIISDIHSNREALETVLAELYSVEQVFCLGILSDMAQTRFLYRKMKELNCTCIKGNHEGGLTGELDLQYFSGDAKQSLLWTKNN